jgi:hypothetical protein
MDALMRQMHHAHMNTSIVDAEALRTTTGGLFSCVCIRWEKRVYSNIRKGRVTWFIFERN